MNYYYWFNRKELLKKAQDKYHKSCFVLSEKQRNNKKREKERYRSMTDIERNEKKRKSLERYYKLKAQYKE